MDDMDFGDTIHVPWREGEPEGEPEMTVITHTWEGPEALALLGLAGSTWLWDVAVDEGWATRDEIAVAVADVLRPEEPHSSLNAGS